MQGKVQNNIVTLCGIIVSEFQYNYTVHDENFYTVFLQVERDSGTFDVLPLSISENITDLDTIKVGDYVKVSGQFRSFNKLMGENKTRLILSVHVRSLEKDTEPSCDMNEVYLDGYICKNPTYRITPKGRRITDVILAVNRAYGRSDYIPCLFWGDDAYVARGFEIGTNCIIKGRIQSREYEKNNGISNEIKTAYEVSIKSIISTN